MALVKAVGQANLVYYMANGKYTSDLRDLDLDIPGEEAVHTVPRRVTRYFSYRAMLSPASVPVEGIALANRLPVNTRYAIGFMEDGSLKCFYKSGSNKDKQICAGLNLPSQAYW